MELNLPRRPAHIAPNPLGITKVGGSSLSPQDSSPYLLQPNLCGNQDCPSHGRQYGPWGHLIGQMPRDKAWELVVPQSRSQNGPFWSSPGPLPSSLGPPRPPAGIRL